VAAAPGTVAGEAARRHLLEIEAAAKPVGKKPKPAPKAR
jgi:hypothetical protein